MQLGKLCPTPYNVGNLQNAIQNPLIYLWVNTVLSHTPQLDCPLPEGGANFTASLRGPGPTLSLHPTPAEAPDTPLQI